MIRFILRLSLLLFTFLLHIQSASAVKIVRLQLEYGGAGEATGGFAFAKVNRVLDLELFDDVKPITVTNYLNYVNSDLYDSTFINRSLPGFVLQTGGVTNTPADPENDTVGGALGVVAPFLPIINEPGLPNIRGSIAMAKINDQPDSATSEWFINLDDNTDPLDTDNGGFTVFGSVIDDGMAIADEIATFPTANIGLLFGSSYTNLPLADYDSSGIENIFQRNLVMILDATEISRPILRYSSAEATSTETDTIIDVVVMNTGTETLDTSTLTTSDSNSPFTVLDENCSNTTLVPTSVSSVASCLLQLSFNAETICEPEDQIVISYTSQVSSDSFSATYNALNSFNDSDSDNVISLIERLAPNQGDGNNDGTADEEQGNVASLSMCQDGYVTLVAEDAQIATASNVIADVELKNVRLVADIAEGAPESSNFDQRLYQFSLQLPNNGIIGDSVRVGLFLPGDVKVQSYMRYGPTPDNTVPHWYDFSFDEATLTGASLLGKVTVTSPSGETLKRSVVLVSFVDGLRGDDDLTANGVIVNNLGGVDGKISSKSSSGFAGYLWASVLLFCFRRWRKI